MPVMPGLAPVEVKRMAGREGPRLAGKVLLWLFSCLHWRQDGSPRCQHPTYHSFLGSVFLPAAPLRRVACVVRVGGELCLALIAQGIMYPMGFRKGQ